MARNPYAFDGFQMPSIGAALARGQQYRINEQASRIAQAQEDAQSRLRPLKQLGEELALRGQFLGSVETPEDYAAILPTIQAAGLPMADLPEDRRSTASQTFRRPEVPATSQARAPWMPDFGAPMAPAALPAGELAAQGIAPEDVPTIQRRAQAGLPLQVQQRFQDADVGRMLQREQIAANLAKYAEQGRYRESAEGRARDAAERAQQKSDQDAALARLNASIKARELELTGPGGQALTQAIKDLPVSRDNAKTALTGLETLTRMEELLSSGAGARPGMIKVGIGRLFGYQSEDMAQAEEYQLLAETLRGPLREDIVGPGPMTEAEQRLLGQVTGGGSTGIKAAKALLANYKEKSRKKIEGYNRQVETLSKYDATIPDLYKPIEIPGAGRGAPAKPAAQFKETKVYNGATYGRNSPSENWKLVK